MFALVLWSLPLAAHELHGHQGPTYEITDPIRIETGRTRLRFSVLDRETGKPTAARFSLVVDGKKYIPSALGENGLRFVPDKLSRSQLFNHTCYDFFSFFQKIQTTCASTKLKRL